MQGSLPAGGLRLCREGVEPSGSLRKVSGYISILLSRTSPVARVVYAKRPFAGPKAVLVYLSRYTHRVAISNSRLIALNETGVTFKWKDYRIKGRHRLKTMTLAPPSSSVVFSCTCCRAASTASATTASSPARSGRTTSSALGDCSRRRKPLPNAHAPRPTARPKTSRLHAAARAAAAG